jgi:hypothetical protein
MSARFWRRVAAAALFCVPFAIEGQEARPPLSGGRVAGEAFAGAYAGIGGFIIGRYIGERTSDVVGVRREDTRRRVGFATGVVIAGLATAGTVYAIGNIGDETGDFDATFLGAGVGFAGAMVLARMTLGPAERPREGMSTAARWAAANVIAFLPSIGATIGFNSTRRVR